MGKQHLHNRLLVLKRPGERHVGDIHGRVNRSHLLEALGDQHLGHSLPLQVEAFDLAGLDGEGTLLGAQSDLHGAAVEFRILEFPAHRVPACCRFPVSCITKIVEGCAEVEDRSPSGVGRPSFV